MADSAKRNAARLDQMREDYRLAELREENCATNPMMQFEKWFHEAQAADLKEPNAMTLATAGSDGRPAARIVLLKTLEEDGFVFYTNYGSRKGQELAADPRCALTFYWAELERQVRVEGSARKVSMEKSEAYFKGRPKGSRLGALVSRQSDEIASREILDAKLAELEARYAGSDDVPMPDNWGGYLVRPELVEFWQGRTNRLHDRILYRRTADGNWTITRLSP